MYRITILQYFIQISHNSSQASSSTISAPSTTFSSSLTLHHNPLLSLSPDAYTRQIWNEFYPSLSSTHPSPILLSCLLDGLQFTYCPSGDLTQVFNILLQAAIPYTDLLTRVFALAQSYISHSQVLLLEL